MGSSLINHGLMGRLCLEGFAFALNGTYIHFRPRYAESSISRFRSSVPGSPSSSMTLLYLIFMLCCYKLSC